MISAGAKILGNVEIGQGAKVAAGSVVLDNVEMNTTVAGVPAVAVALRRSEVHVGPRGAQEADCVHAAALGSDSDGRVPFVVHCIHVGSGRAQLFHHGGYELSLVGVVVVALCDRDV